MSHLAGDSASLRQQVFRSDIIKSSKIRAKYP